MIRRSRTQHNAIADAPQIAESCYTSPEITCVTEEEKQYLSRLLPASAGGFGRGYDDRLNILSGHDFLE